MPGPGEDPQAFVDEYARRFNQASPTGDFTALAELRTPEATVVWRAADQPEVTGRLGSVAVTVPRDARLSFEDAEKLDDGRIRARLTGDGFPPGEVRGTAWFELADGLIARLVIELDDDITLRR